jgi:hypothetical protein
MDARAARRYRDSMLGTKRASWVAAITTLGFVLGCASEGGFRRSRVDGGDPGAPPPAADGGPGSSGHEACNGLDDDRDGEVDEGCTCEIGSVQPCWGGDPALAGVGACTRGTQTCVEGGVEFARWGECVGAGTPSTERCNERDDDCDGATDEGCSCTPRETRPCWTGPPEAEGVGACRAGTQTCEPSADGASAGWGGCFGAVLPAPEACNGADDDCDGEVDDGCECIPGATRPCYEGPAGTRGIGLCRDGVQRCEAGAGGVGSRWSLCEGATLPSMELCNGADDDCDGVPDQTCACRPGETRSCYSGPPGTRGIGLCRDGSQSCVASGSSASWGACVGERLPAAETCDGRDEDCDGRTDEGACRMPPTVRCPSPVTTRPLVPVTLTATASDPDGVIASYGWTLVSAPAGASGTFSMPTSASTQFTPNLVGVYTVQVTVRDDHGLSASCTTTVTATGDGIRVELTWNTDRTDVDLHLLRMAGGTGWFNVPNDCYYANRRPMWDAPGTMDDPRLDIDDVDGFGPENINIDVPVVGAAYRVGVHYYADRGVGPSAVTVRIYCGDISVTPAATFMRTLSNGSGLPDANDFWRVADVVWAGEDRCTVRALDTLTTGGVARTTP